MSPGNKIVDEIFEGYDKREKGPREARAIAPYRDSMVALGEQVEALQKENAKLKRPNKDLPRGVKIAYRVPLVLVASAFVPFSVAGIFYEASKLGAWIGVPAGISGLIGFFAILYAITATWEGEWK